ncbi:MAG TPA: aldehyde dehydrogenase family protein [Candidatus Dormibacteraeota bacterium]|nr:aldehyde dehydrogenase family protein [Candidatus Dormibacteraeota bacterium]
MDVRKTYKLYAGGAFVRSESGRSYLAEGVNVPRASRKDVRDAVRSARGAFNGWSRRTAMNRGQVLYRVAEMLDARRSQFAALLGGGRAAGREVDAAVDAFVWYAGLTDKLAQLVGTVNPVAGPYFTFTLPEPTGVVGVVAPDEPALLGLVRSLAPVLCGGSTVVALTSEPRPLAALCLGEVLATGDVPAGVVNLLSGRRAELLPWLAAHMDVNAIDAAGCSPEELAGVEEAAAASVKRVVRPDGDGAPAPWRAAAFMELKTVWHPVGV